MGVFAALGTALCWAIAARLYKHTGDAFTPLSMVFWKGVISIALLIIVVVATGAPLYSPYTLAILLASGFIGIGIGDTFFFKALKSIGDSQAVLVAETLAPIFTALFAMAFIGEWLTWHQWVGIAVVLLSIDMVIKTTKKEATHIFARSGYLFGVGAALCQAIGAVMSRDVFVHFDMDAASAALYRLLGSMVFVVPFILATGARCKPKVNTTSVWKAFVFATLLGTTGAIYLQMLAFANTKAAVVQTLIATSAIMSLGVAKLMGDSVSRAIVYCSVGALIGVGLLVSG